jgi:hypothetical protein
VLAKSQGATDGPDPTTGIVRGTVTSASPLTLADTTATFPTSGIVGAPLDITAGRGRGQRRTIVAATSTTLTLSQPFTVLPDTTSTYQIGGVKWEFATGKYRFLLEEGDSQRRVQIHFTPVEDAATGSLQAFFDEDPTPQTWIGDYTFDEHQGVQVTTGDSNLDIDFTHSTGTTQQRADLHRELYTEGPRFVSYALSGVTNSETQLISEILLDGVSK